MGGNKWFAYASLARDEINRGAVFAVVCDFTAGTVHGFTYPGADLRLTITKFDDVHILFGGSKRDWSINGSIDRVTGDVAATSMMRMTTGIISSTSITLKCLPAQRMF